VRVIGLLVKKQELLFCYVIDIVAESNTLVIGYRVRTEWSLQATLTYILLRLIR